MIDNITSQALVDMAIRYYEEGNHRDAYQMLDDLGFNKEDQRRLLCHPESRKSYINDFVTGF